MDQVIIDIGAELVKIDTGERRINDSRANAANEGVTIKKNPTAFNFGSNFSLTDNGTGVDIGLNISSSDTHADIEEDGSLLVSDVDAINFGSNVTASDDGDGTVTVDSSDSDTTDHANLTNVQSGQHHTKTEVYIGKFRITSSGTQTISGLPFAPDMVEFQSQAPVESYDNEEAGGGNTNTTDNFGGSMTGFARNDSGTTVQQAIASGVSGNSVNAIRSGASSSHCIAHYYGGQNGNEIGQIEASLSSFNSDGFDINTTTFSGIDESGVVVIFKAFKRS